MPYKMLMSLLTEFETDCRKCGVNPRAALEAGGVHPSLWKKWTREEGAVSPTLRNFEAAKKGLALLRSKKKAA